MQLNSNSNQKNGMQNNWKAIKNMVVNMVLEKKNFKKT
jgi:hypothetical protein